MYGKVFASIFDSSLVADGGWLPTYVFMSMITIADKDGLVDIAPRALYRRLGFRDDGAVSHEDFRQALDYLCQDDPDSRSASHGGKRLIPVSQIEEIEGNRGWLIVNYALYRQKASHSEPSGSSTARVRRFRARHKHHEVSSRNGDETACNGDETGSNGEETMRNGHTDTDIDIGNTPDGVLPLSDVTYVTSSGEHTEKSARSANCPYRQIVEAYNAAAHATWIPASMDTIARSEKANIRARWQWLLKRKIRHGAGETYGERPDEAIDWFRRFFAYAASCDGLTRENNIGWAVDLPWLMREANFLKTIRGTNQGHGGTR